MKGIGLGLIVVALVAASFLAEAGVVEMSAKETKAWGQVAGVALIYAAWWFTFGDDS